MIVLLACAQPAPTLVADPQHLADCRGLDRELGALCHVQVAAASGRSGDAAMVGTACDAFGARTDPFLELWADECHFRGGEELARAGELETGLRHCEQAGRFANYCFTHAAWQVPPTTDSLADWEKWGDPFGARSVDTLRARWWFNQYFGSGQAAPPTVDDPHARTAWALEAVRLCKGDLACANAAWHGGLRGDPLPGDRRLGRYDLPFALAEDDGARTVPTFGGGERYVGATVDEDVQVAILEGAYFRESVGGGAFVPFLRDPRPRVRWTAIARYRTLPSDDAPAVLAAMRDDPDPVVAALVADALQFRTWEGKRNLPGLKKDRPAP